MESINDGTAGVDKLQSPKDFSKAAVIEPLARTTETEHTLVDNTDVEKYHKVHITQQL